MINADGSGQTDVSVGAFDSDWSTDGNRIAFSFYTGVQIANSSYANIQIANPDGSGVINLTEGSDPQWSPVANEIAYLLNDELWLVQPEDGTPRRLADDIYVPLRIPGQDAEKAFAWAPDGSRIAYVSRKTNQAVYLSVVGLDGTAPMHLVDFGQLTSTINGADKPIWSPDESHIALDCGGLCIADMNGSILKVPDALWISSIAWSRDGKRVYVGNWNQGIYVYDMTTGRVAPVLISDFRSFSGFALRPDSP